MAPILIGAAIAVAKQVLPSLVGKIAGDSTGRVASTVLEVAERATGIDLNEGDDALGRILGAIEGDDPKRVEVTTRLAELEAEETRAELEVALASVREMGSTARAELASQDARIRFARPFAIYVATIAAAVVVLATIVVFFAFSKEHMADWLMMLEALTWPLGMISAIAGVYTWKRSDDKAKGVASAVPGPLRDVLP